MRCEWLSCGCVLGSLLVFAHAAPVHHGNTPFTPSQGGTGGAGAVRPVQQQGRVMITDGLCTAHTGLHRVSHGAGCVGAFRCPSKRQGVWEIQSHSPGADAGIISPLTLQDSFPAAAGHGAALSRLSATETTLSSSGGRGIGSGSGGGSGSRGSSGTGSSHPHHRELLNEAVQSEVVLHPCLHRGK